jgi:alpha-tubulin suppressor-like RCC1 family protein
MPKNVGTDPPKSVRPKSIAPIHRSNQAFSTFTQQNALTVSASAGFHLARELQNKRVLVQEARHHQFIGSAFHIPRQSAVQIMSFLAPDELARLVCSCSLFNDALETAACMQAKSVYHHPLPARQNGESISELLQFVAFISKQGSIAAGLAHSMVISKEGKVMSFGYGQAGRTGLGCRNMNVPTVVGRLANIKVRAVSAGGAHSLVVTASGTLYSFGAGDDGKLGHGDKLSIFQPKVVSALFGQRIAVVSANDTHSVVVTATGVVQSFGFGRNGRLGHGDEANQLLPKPIAALAGRRITSVSAGAQCTFVCSSGGSVWSFGYGADGQLGHGPDTLGDQLVPKRLACFHDTKVERASVGDRHTLLVTEGGVLYSFGTGESGQLGDGDGVGRVMTPQPVAAMAGVKVSRVAAGYEHSLVIAAEGSVYSFGSGASGQLGTGEAGAEALPRKLAGVPTDVVDCATCSHHSMVVTASGGLLTFGSGGGGVLGHGNSRMQLAPKLVAAVAVLQQSSRYQ